MCFRLRRSIRSLSHPFILSPSLSLFLPLPPPLPLLSFSPSLSLSPSLPPSLSQVPDCCVWLLHCNLRRLVRAPHLKPQSQPLVATHSLTTDCKPASTLCFWAKHFTLTSVQMSFGKTQRRRKEINTCESCHAKFKYQQRGEVGVPQGSFLWPFLFSCSVSTGFMSSANAQLCGVSLSLHQISVWRKNNCLQLNSDKTEMIVFELPQKQRERVTSQFHVIKTN